MQRQPLRPPALRKPEETNEREAEVLVAIQRAIDRLNTVKALVKGASSRSQLPAGNITIVIDDERVDMLTDGTVLYAPSTLSRKGGHRTQLPHAHYVVAGPKGKRCTCCAGSGRQ
jgi:hypothetical protein